MDDKHAERVTGTGWLLVSDQRVKKVLYDLTLCDGGAGKIGPADEKGPGLWILDNRHLTLELDDGRKPEIRTRTDGEIVVEGIL